MLTSFTLKNFKSFKEATLHLTPTVTFLIGANASGKSNALEALILLKCLGKGKSLREIESEMNSPSQPLIRCPSNEIFNWFDGKSFEFDCALELENEKYSYVVIIQKDNNGKLIFKKERLLNVREKEIVYTTDNEETKKQNQNPLVDVTRKISGNDGQALFLGLNVFAHLIKNNTLTLKENENILRIRKKTEQICSQFSSIFFLESTPGKMRGYARQIERMPFSESGENLSAILEELCRDEKVKQNILEIIRSLPEQEILNINFSKTDENFMMVKLEESFSNKHHKTLAYSLSDGTLRALAIATALYSVPEGSLLVIEEVDNGIHPSRIKHLVDKMYEIAAERKIQILVTTHDPAMMNAIPPQEKGNVLCCYRSKEDGTSKILRIADSPHSDVMIISEKLGDFATNWELYDSLVKDTRTAEEVYKAKSDWLNDFLERIDAINTREAR